MIFNQLSFGLVITATVVFHSVQVNACSCVTTKKFNSEFDKALDLSTGFDYCRLENLHRLKLENLKRILQVKEMPRENTIHDGIDMFYCDLACGNMYLLYNYFKLSNLDGDIYLSETITGRMLASLFKINKTIYGQSFWYAHMSVLHRSQHQNTPDDDCIKCMKEFQNTAASKLDNRTYDWCRKNNQFKMIVADNVYDSDKTIKLREIIAIIDDTQKQNDILFENETEKDWASLKSIYLHEIMENEDILSTIVTKFGDQNKESFNAIRDDLYKSYDAAKNYYHLDKWIHNLFEYQSNILNIIKRVALHLIYKHFLYASKHWKSKKKFFSNYEAVHYKIKNIILENNFFKSIFKYDKQVLKMIKTLSEWTEVSDDVNVTHYQLISDVVQIMKKLSPKFAEIDNKEPFTASYLGKISSENEKLMSSIKISEDDSKKIKKFQSKFGENPVSDNLTRIILYLRYLETIFKDYNIETALTFVESFRSYKGCGSAGQTSK